QTSPQEVYVGYDSYTAILVLDSPGSNGVGDLVTPREQGTKKKFLGHRSYSGPFWHSEEPHGSCTKKGWLLLFAMAPWERLKFILVTYLLYSQEKTQKTRIITNSRAGERSHFLRNSTKNKVKANVTTRKL
ncbi:hypothetical protein NQ317_018794, partial [Molorchus minor]